MATSENQNIDAIIKKIDDIKLVDINSIARVIPLYHKAYNNNGVLNGISFYYIEHYNGESFLNRFKKFFEPMYEMFLLNGITEEERKIILKTASKKIKRIPQNLKEMRSLYEVVIASTHALIKDKTVKEAKKNIVGRFRQALTKYMSLTYKMGFNAPSECAKMLAKTHRIDRYIMSGEFSLMLLPFLPEVENEIRKSYEHYELTDSWENLKGSYFDNIGQYRNLSLEIKKLFTQNIPNFSEYIDRIYTDKFKNLMLKGNINT